MCNITRITKVMGIRAPFKFLPLLCITWLSLGRWAKGSDPPISKMSAQEFIGDEAGLGYIAAFGDVNSDKQTDVFVISGDGLEIYIFLGSEISPALNLHQTIKVGSVATSVVPGDFNGDDVTDLLVTSKHSSEYSLFIYWGDENGRIKAENRYSSPDTFKDEPLVLDANADMISDLFVTYSINQSRGFLVGQSKQDNWSFVRKQFRTKETQPTLAAYFPNSNAFIDLTGEGSADLFVTSIDHNKKLVYEVWEGTSAGLSMAKRINTADNEYFQDPQLEFSPVSFADFNADGKQDVLVAVCKKDGDRCKDGKILMYAGDEWHVIFTDTEEWGFPDKADALLHQSNTLHVADFNLDSYPDILTIMQSKDGVRKAVILYNGVCSSGMCIAAKRQLNVSFELPDSDNAVLAAFYDFNMDGTLDVIVTNRTDARYEMLGYTNMIADDVTFLRVQVLSGHVDKVLYGVNVQGPQIKYETTNPMGGPQYGSLGQLSQTAHLSLQLPFVIFGLGRLANFVDRLTVSIPVPLITDMTANADTKHPNVTFTPLNNTWPMLIPNSQLYVVPYPRTSPESWKNKLLVTPSRNVVATAIALLGTCGLLIIATLILHWMEKREDKREKIQEAYKFHFDAM